MILIIAFMMAVVIWMLINLEMVLKDILDELRKRES